MRGVVGADSVCFRSVRGPETESLLRPPSHFGTLKRTLLSFFLTDFPLFVDTEAKLDMLCIDGVESLDSLSAACCTLLTCAAAAVEALDIALSLRDIGGGDGIVEGAELDTVDVIRRFL